MGPFLAAIQVIGGPIPLVIEILAAIAALFLAVRIRPRGSRLRWALITAAALVVGASIGLLACWLMGDVANLFDITLSPVTRTWIALAFAGIALAIVNLPRSRPLRRAAAVASVLLFAIMGAIGVNADFGQYPTVASMLGMSRFADLPAGLLAAQAAANSTAPAPTAELALWQTWLAPADLPSKGIVGAVAIPAPVSHFAARRAVVYLPPAALVANPPALPVLVMLSGQPGSPEHVFISGHLDQVIDRMAAANNGLAPIVVVPDQLSAPNINPMCVDGPIGNSATYLTVDVPAWVRANLHVQSVAAAWGIGGYSQGGTCAIQLGAGHPDLFGSIVDVSGELEPQIGSPETTIAKGFRGDAAAYTAAKPLALISRHGPFADTVAVFGAGQLDTKYTAWIATIATAAHSAGMHTIVISSPGTGHDWHTVRYVWEHGLSAVFAHMGLVKGAS